MPSPRDDENKKDFMPRCMSDDKSKQSFPEADQRVAFCHSQWENKGRSSAAYVYEDPHTGELFYYSRRGKHRKNGRVLIFRRKSKGSPHILNITEETYLDDTTGSSK